MADKKRIERLFSAREPRLVLMEDKLANQKKLTWIVLATLVGTVCKMLIDVMMTAS